MPSMELPVGRAAVASSRYSRQPSGRKGRDVMATEHDHRRRYGACVPMSNGGHPDNEVHHLDRLYLRTCGCECHAHIGPDSDHGESREQ